MPPKAPGSLYNTPDCVVRLTSLLSALFVRPIYDHYYFGDYYGDQYQQLGFYPWIVYGPRYFDPLFGYYSWANADNYGWYEGLRNTYLGRLHGDLPRPPRTLAQQQNMLRSGRYGAGAAGRNGFRGRNGLQMVTPLGQYHSNRQRLAPVSAQERRTQGGMAQGFQQARRQRATTESSFSRGGGALGQRQLRLPSMGGTGRPGGFVGREPLSGGRSVGPGSTLRAFPGARTSFEGRRPLPQERLMGPGFQPLHEREPLHSTTHVPERGGLPGFEPRLEGRPGRPEGLRPGRPFAERPGPAPHVGQESHPLRLPPWEERGHLQPEHRAMMHRPSPGPHEIFHPSPRPHAPPHPAPHPVSHPAPHPASHPAPHPQPHPAPHPGGHPDGHPHR
jgi:hypothetical protein